MKIYNRYQEAKIENPDFAIFNYQGKFGTDKDIIDYFDINSASMKECCPADYCITLGELRDLYGGEVGGDVIFGHVSGVVKTILEEEASGREYDAGNFVLRSSAMEIPTQSPEEKEALDMIDTTSKQVESLAKGDVVEWKNGDKCVIKNPEGFGVWEEANKYLGTTGTVMAIFTNTNGLEVAAVSHDDEICICWMLSMLEKPESPEQKAERERDEKAKQIMIDICGDEVFRSRDWDYHKRFSHNAKMAFQLVDLGYCKEK